MRLRPSQSTISRRSLDITTLRSWSIAMLLGETTSSGRTFALRQKKVKGIARCGVKTYEDARRVGMIGLAQSCSNAPMGCTLGSASSAEAGDFEINVLAATRPQREPVRLSSSERSASYCESLRSFRA
jgi:hypothetical protein